MKTNRIPIATILFMLIVIYSCTTETKKKHIYNIRALDSLGNIYLKISPDSTRQLTFSNKDISPYYNDSLKLVLFARKLEREQLAIMTIKVHGLTEKIIDTVGYFIKPTFSKDQSKAAFIDNLKFVIVDLENNNSKPTIESIGYIRLDNSGYVDNFLSVFPKEDETGNYILSYNLLDENGIEKMHFETRENVLDFFKQEAKNKVNMVNDLLILGEEISLKINMMKDISNEYLLAQENLLIKQTELFNAKKRLTQINEFQFGRSLSEKERQIKDQNSLIEFTIKEVEQKQEEINMNTKKLHNLEKEIMDRIKQ